MARIPSWVKVLMLKGEKGEKGDGLSVSETPIDNGHQVTITDADGSVSFDLHNATSGDYSGLTNKPQINGNLISGNKTGADLGLVDMSKIVVITGRTSEIGGARVSVTIDYHTLSEYGIKNPAKCAVLAFSYKDSAFDDWFTAPTVQYTTDNIDYVFPHVIISKTNNVWSLQMNFYALFHGNYIDYRLVLMQLDR